MKTRQRQIVTLPPQPPYPPYETLLGVLTGDRG